MVSDSSRSANPVGIRSSHPAWDVTVLAVEGELDLATSPNLKWALLEALHSGRPKLVVDLAAVSFMDSTALGVLVSIARGLEHDQRIALAGVQPDVRRVLEITGLEDAFATYATVDEALVG